MKVICYPADNYGCGHHRIIWPATYLREAGYDVEVVTPDKRSVSLQFDKGRLVHVDIDPSVDVVVFQRTTDFRIVQAVHWLREHGFTVVIDVDDDLAAIHPANPAFTFLNPHRAEHEVRDLIRTKQLNPQRAPMVLSSLQKQYTHSWEHLARACREASLVTFSTPALRTRYGRPERQAVVRNYLADHYYEVDHTDSDLLGWPAALHSHPNDPAVLGNSVRRLVQQDGARFLTIGDNDGVAAAFGLTEEPEHVESASPQLWPAVISQLGVGIVPLADTRFNTGKSWLKGLELSAVGVPWVGSPRAEYHELHRLGAGLLAKDQRDWQKLLYRLLHSPDYRAELAGRGRETAEKLRLRDHAELWWLAWEKARALDAAQKPVIA